MIAGITPAEWLLYGVIALLVLVTGPTIIGIFTGSTRR